MYLLGFAIVVICHVCMCVGYSPVPSLPNFGEIYYTNKDLYVRLLEAYTQYEKLRNVYSNVSQSVNEAYNESMQAQKKCGEQINELRKNFNNSNKLEEFIAEEVKIIEDILNGYDNTTEAIHELKSALITEEVISTALISKIEDVKARQKISLRLLEQENIFETDFNEKVVLQDYDKMYKLFLSLLEFSHYFEKEIVTLKKIRFNFQSIIFKNYIQCQKRYVQLIIDLREYNIVQGTLEKNIETLKKYVKNLNTDKFQDYIKINEKLNNVQNKNVELKKEAQTLTQVELAKEFAAKQLSGQHGK